MGEGQTANKALSNGCEEERSANRRNHDQGTRGLKNRISHESSSSERAVKAKEEKFKQETCGCPHCGKISNSCGSHATHFPTHPGRFELLVFRGKMAHLHCLFQATSSILIWNNNSTFSAHKSMMFTFA